MKPHKHLYACGAFALGGLLARESTISLPRGSFPLVRTDLICPPLIGGHGAVLVQGRTHRRQCNTVPRKFLVAGAGRFCRQARRQYRPPYSTATDAEPLNTVLRVLSCGPEWGGVAPHRRPIRFTSRLHLAERLWNAATTPPRARSMRWRTIGLRFGA